MTQKSFVRQIHNNKQALMAFAKKLSRDDEKAKDLVQETLIKAFKAKDRFDPDRNFKSWTFTILKNTFVSDYRKNQRSKIVSLPIEEFSHLKYEVDEGERLKEYIFKLRKSIEKLSSKSKEPIQLYLRGYRYEEISSHLEIPVGTVKSRLNFAKSKLRNFMTAS